MTNNKFNESNVQGGIQFNGAAAGANKWNISQMESRVELVTPDIAKEYLAHNTVNRPLSKKQMHFYAEVMRKGQWKLNGEAICFDTSGALVNGQTRLNAVIEYGGTVAFLVVRNCDTDCFKTYDSGRNRKTSDVFAIERIPNYNIVSGAITAYYSLTKRRLAIDGTTSIRKEFVFTKEDSLNEYWASPELWQKAARLAARCAAKAGLMRKTEISGLYAYLVKERHYSEDIVEAFFMMLFYNENVTNHTITLLRDRIVQSMIGTNKITGAYKQALVIKTWNAYVKHIEYKTLRWNEASEGKIWFD